MRRTYEANEINSIINSENVKETALFAGQWPVNVAPLMNERNVFLIEGGCGFLFQEKDDGYEGHSFCLREARGSAALRAGRNAIRWMFNNGAEKIYGFTPISNLAARKYNRLLGFKSKGTHEHEMENGVIMECEEFILRRSDL